MSTGGGINKYVFHKEKENLRWWKTAKCKLRCTQRSVRWPFFSDDGGGRSTGSGSFQGKGERWRQIEGLSLIRLPYRWVHSAGSAAVSKLKLTGSAGAACSNGPAGLGLTVIRRLDFLSLAPAKKSPDLLKGSARVPSNKIHIKHLLM